MLPAEDLDTFVEGFEGLGDPEDPDAWLPPGWSEYPYNGRTDWQYSGPGKVGFGCAAILNWEVGSSSGILNSRSYDLSKTTWVKYSVWFRDIGIDNGDLKVWFKNKYSNWVLICDLNVAAWSPDPQSWRYYEVTTSSSDYLHSSFAVRYQAMSITDAEKACIDQHTIVCPNPVRKYAIVVCSTAVDGGEIDKNNWLSKLPGLGFMSENTFVYCAEAFDKATIRQKVQWVAGTADWNDKVLFAYTGHGAQQSGQTGYLDFKYEYYYDYELKADLQNTAAAGVLIFLCSCCSGCFLDQFAGMSRFFVATATDLDGSTYSMGPVSQLANPYPRNARSSGTPRYDSMWTFWFLNQLDSRPLEQVFGSALSAYREWYVGTYQGYGSWGNGKWVWQCTGVIEHPPDAEHPLGWIEWVYSYVFETWRWDEGGEPYEWAWIWDKVNGVYVKRNAVPIGAPQMVDGNPSLPFYL